LPTATQDVAPVHDTPDNEPSELPTGVGPVAADQPDPVRVSTRGKYR
jgi:hypothetical protein